MLIVNIIERNRREINWILNKDKKIQGTTFPNMKSGKKYL